jgi:hypothetical protein
MLGGAALMMRAGDGVMRKRKRKRKRRKRRRRRL